MDTTMERIRAGLSRAIGVVADFLMPPDGPSPQVREGRSQFSLVSGRGVDQGAEAAGRGVDRFDRSRFPSSVGRFSWGEIGTIAAVGVFVVGMIYLYANYDRNGKRRD